MRSEACSAPAHKHAPSISFNFIQYYFLFIIFANISTSPDLRVLGEVVRAGGDWRAGQHLLQVVEQLAVLRGQEGDGLPWGGGDEEVEGETMRGK